MPYKRTKTTKFDHDLSSYAKALGHPQRVLILRTLLEKKQCLCQDLVKRLNLSQSTVSQHLGYLRAAWLIDYKKDGPRHWYSPNKDHLDKMKYLLGELK